MDATEIQNLGQNISPFLLADIVKLVMKRKALSFYDALVYVTSSDMYANLRKEETKLWYLSSMALYDMLEEENQKLRRKKTDNQVLIFQMFCLENYQIEKGISTNEVLSLFGKYQVFDFLEQTFEMLHTQSREYIIETIATYIKKKK